MSKAVRLMYMEMLVCKRKHKKGYTLMPGLLPFNPGKYPQDHYFVRYGVWYE